MWQRLKKAVKRLIGKENVQRVSLLQAYLHRLGHRSWRGGKLLFFREKISFPKIYKFAADKGQTFFGYYDVTPFSKKNDLVLAMVGPQENRSPMKNEEIAVGYFDRHDGSTFHEVDKTSTWCWQQGCRLQWFPQDENELIIYNTMVNESYGSVIQNIRTKTVLRHYKMPIYDIDSTGEWALSLNFSRLGRLRPGYGYINIPDRTEGDRDPVDDGIWLMSLSAGKGELLHSLQKLSQVNPLPSMEGAEHYINHLSFNPSGQRFMFFHLWVKGKP